MEPEFSFRSRGQSLEQFRSETFDLLIIGGGITGAAVARDAVSRGLKVALVEKNDFAFGTSSRSSKLIHGGLRYLENWEFGLVFESLAERALLLKTVPTLVRPLPFYLPVYAGEPHGRGILSLGLWLYDLLALFRTPGFHRSLSRKAMLREIPFLKSEGLKGGFRYFDASMWDDLLAVEILRSAASQGATVANYLEAVEPVWQDGWVSGFRVRDLARISAQDAETFEVRAARTVVCVGPWTDQLGLSLSKDWTRWLNPSKGIHLVFDWKRIPIPGAMVMSHPQDGRISFVIPRKDYGAGVVIVGTTDGPAPADPEKVKISPEDVDYLFKLLNQYFPELKLGPSDILSAYVGVRPLVGPSVSLTGSEGQSNVSLQKVSREHHLDRGPGGTVIVAGGKYTTHRKMAEEIVDFTLKQWRLDATKAPQVGAPPKLSRPETRKPLHSSEAIGRTGQSTASSWAVPRELQDLYGVEAEEIVKIHQESTQKEGLRPLADPEGFPCLEAQLRFAIRTQMVLHLEDFYLRRTALFASRKDHGLPWAERLSKVWAQELGRSESEAWAEKGRLEKEIQNRTRWWDALSPANVF